MSGPNAWHWGYSFALDKPHNVSVLRGQRSVGTAEAEKLEETSRRGIVVATIWLKGPKRDGLYLVFTRKRIEVWAGGATEEEVDGAYNAVYIKHISPEYIRYRAYGFSDISPATRGEIEVGYSIDPRLIDPKQLIESVQKLLRQYVHRMQERLQIVTAYESAVTALI